MRWALLAAVPLVLTIVVLATMRWFRSDGDPVSATWSPPPVPSGSESCLRVNFMQLGSYVTGACTKGPPLSSAVPRSSVGTLTVFCSPYCDHVLVDGREAGGSPVLAMPVAAGKHSVSLQRGAAPTKEVVAIIRAGQETVVAASTDL